MIGVLGGSFDPVHMGHLRVGIEVKQALDLKAVRFVPCHLPPHRARPVATPQQRARLLQAVLSAEAGEILDTREYQRRGPSYMRDTLSSMNNDAASQSVPETLCLIVGADAFQHFTEWHRWQEILTLAHIVVVTRPFGDALEPLEPWIETHRVNNKQTLRDKTAGCIYHCPITPLDISSSQIRKNLKQGKDCRHLVPDNALTIIKQEKLYH